MQKVLDWSVCICLTQLYADRDMYRIYYIKNNYMLRPITLAIFRLRNEKTGPSEALFFEHFNKNTHDSMTPKEKHLNLTLQYYLNLI